MAEQYDLGEAYAFINWSEDGGKRVASLSLVRLDHPSGVLRLSPGQTYAMVQALVSAGVIQVAGNADVIADLRDQLAAAQADNDLAQAEIARLTAEKPRKARAKKEASDAPPVEWEGVPAEPAADQGAQEDHLPGFAVGDAVEVLATGAMGTIDRVFADNPRKVVVLLGGTLPKVFDVTELRLAAPNHSDLEGSDLDVPELIAGLEAVGLTVLTEVPEVVVTDMDPEKLRRALYDESKLYGYTPDEMRALIAEIVGEPRSSKELDARQLGQVLRTMHERGVQSRMPY